MMPLDEQALRRLAELEDQCESISAGNPMYWDECRALSTIRQQQDEIQQLRAEAERLRVGEAFHAVTVQQRNEAWARIDCLQTEVERLREERRWRSTKTEPPSDDQWQVLIYDGRNVDIGDKLDGIGWTHEFGTLEWEAVTHWMPLPAPPKEE